MNNTNTMPEIWRTFVIDQKNLSNYSWEENQNGKFMIQVQDYSNLPKIKTVRTIRCKSVTKPVSWSWINR